MATAAVATATTMFVLKELPVGGDQCVLKDVWRVPNDAGLVDFHRLNFKYIQLKIACMLEQGAGFFSHCKSFL